MITRGKAAIGSMTIVGAIIVFISQLVAMFGYVMSSEDLAVLRQFIDSGILAFTAIASMVGAVLSIIGRYRAKKPITGIVVPDKVFHDAIN